MDNAINAALQFAARIGQQINDRFMPCQSTWRVEKVSDPAIGVDLADIASFGVTAVVPVNLDAKGGQVRIALVNTANSERVVASGYGAGMAAGLGWQLPFTSINLGKKIKADPTDHAIATIPLDLPGGGVGHLWTGPSRSGVLGSKDFAAYCALAKVQVNFGPNAVAGGLVMFSTRPLLKPTDLVHVTAFGLLSSIEWSIEVSVEGGLMNYRITEVASAHDQKFQQRMMRAEQMSRTA